MQAWYALPSNTYNGEFQKIMGYKLAGFDVIGCNEIDPKVNQVYVTNHAPRFNFLGDIRELRERERERATARTLQLGYFGRLTPMFHFLLIRQS